MQLKAMVYIIDLWTNISAVTVATAVYYNSQMALFTEKKELYVLTNRPTDWLYNQPYNQPTNQPTNRQTNR